MPCRGDCKEIVEAVATESVPVVAGGRRVRPRGARGAAETSLCGCHVYVTTTVWVVYDIDGERDLWDKWV